MKKFIKIILVVAVLAFAGAGLFFIGGYLLNKYHFTDVAGNVDTNNQIFQDLAGNKPTGTGAALTVDQPDPNELTVDQINTKLAQLYTQKIAKMQMYCKTKAIAQLYGANAQQIMDAYNATNQNDVVREKMIAAVELHTNSSSVQDLAYKDAIAPCANINGDANIPDLDLSKTPLTNNNNALPWITGDYWPVMQAAIGKDAAEINKASVAAGVSPRLVVSALFVEQSRLYTTQREYFKQFFQPLQILANSSQFSLGVMSIKADTAKQIEQNLQDPNSKYYLGDQYAHLLDFDTSAGAPSPDQQRVNRLTDENNHYHSYLYGAIYIRELEQQWKNAGFDISDRPEIIATLFNISFGHSKPSANPQVGGSAITLGGYNYTFGSLAYEFYYSGELQKDFPFITPAN